MKRTDAEMILDYMRTHFEEVETLLKMGLVQNLAKELGAGIAGLQPPKAEKLILQAGGEEWDVSDCRSRVIEDFVSSGHAACAIKSLAIYLKPEERKAYYVVNEKYRGSVDLSERDRTKPAEGTPAEYQTLLSTFRKRIWWVNDPEQSDTQ